MLRAQPVVVRAGLRVPHHPLPAARELRHLVDAPQLLDELILQRAAEQLTSSMPSHLLKVHPLDRTHLGRWQLVRPWQAMPFYLCHMVLMVFATW